MDHPRKQNWNRRAISLTALAGAVLLALVFAFSGAIAASGATAVLRPAHVGDDHLLALSPTNTSLTPNASGTATWEYKLGVLSGHVSATNLPAQGAHLAYVAWYVNTVTGDKAVLGPLVLVGQQTILFLIPGNGGLQFSVSLFTNGTHVGQPIVLAPAGHNLLVVLVENQINFSSPSPIGVSVAAMF